MEQLMGRSKSVVRTFAMAAISMICGFPFVACSVTIDFTDKERAQERPHTISAGEPYEFDYTISCPTAGGCESILRTIAIEEYRIAYPNLNQYQYSPPQNVAGGPVYVYDVFAQHKLTRLIDNTPRPLVRITKSPNVPLPSDARQGLASDEIQILEEFLSETQLRVRGKVRPFVYSGYYTLSVKFEYDDEKTLAMAELIWVGCPRALTMPVRQAMSQLAEQIDEDSVLCDLLLSKVTPEKTLDMLRIDEEKNIGREIVCDSHRKGFWQGYKLTSDIVCAGPPTAVELWNIITENVWVLDGPPRSAGEIPPIATPEYSKARNLLEVSATIFNTVTNSGHILGDAMRTGKLHPLNARQEMANRWQLVKADYERIRRPD